MSEKKKRTKSIAFICPYPFDTAAGQRFRYEQYFGLLREKGYRLHILPFLDEATFSILYKKGHVFRKSSGIMAGFIKRIIHLVQVAFCEYVFIYREATPLGYPVFEWITAKVLHKKIIYDFDDAIWLESTSGENRIVHRLKFPAKVGIICRWAYKVSAGNRYLQNYALQFNERSVINPTTIDTRGYHNRKKDQRTTPVVIGWTGTHSTLIYLDMIYPVLKKLEARHEFVFEVIADKEVRFDLKNFVFRKWTKGTEIDDLLAFHIGIMPLMNDPWSQGKCGFKALQYMALGIPAVVSPVGVNREIIAEGEDGFLCENEEAWFEKLSLLLADPSLRETMGQRGIEKVSRHYSVSSNSENFLSLFR